MAETEGFENSIPPFETLSFNRKPLESCGSAQTCPDLHRTYICHLLARPTSLADGFAPVRIIIRTKEGPHSTARFSGREEWGRLRSECAVLASTPPRLTEPEEWPLLAALRGSLLPS